MTSVFARSETDAEVPWLRESLRRLRLTGMQIHVLAPSWRGLANHSIDGIPVYRFRYAPKPLEILTHDEGAPSKLARRPWFQILAIPYILMGAWACWRLCRRFKPDVIHAHWPFPHGLMAWPAGRFLGIPLVLNFHGAELLLTKRYPWVAVALRFVLQRAQGIICNSSFTSSAVKKLHRVETRIIPYGTTIAYRGLPARPLRENEVFNVLFVGRHIERKGIEYLIQAAELLSADRFCIRIVGQGDLTDRLKGMARGLRHVVFTGKLNSVELQEEYARAHCFVLPAIVDSKGDTEGLGVVLIEAAEAGLALVASDVGGIPDVVIHGKTGLLVAPRDSRVLAQTLIQLSEDDSLRQRLVINAQLHIRAHFDWDVITRKQISLYQEVRLQR